MKAIPLAFAAAVIVTLLEEPVKVGLLTEPAGVYDPEALSLKASAFRLPVEPNSFHLLPLQTYSFSA